jgi:hypothetical protein
MEEKRRGMAIISGIAVAFTPRLGFYPQLDYGIAVCGNETNYNTAAVTNMIVTS